MSKKQVVLVDATGVKPKRGEDRNDFLIRLVNHLDDEKKFNDDDFAKLPDDVQKWVNAACKAVGAKPPKPIADFPDLEPAGAAGDKGKDAKAPKEPKAAKEPKAPKEKPEPKPRGTGKGAALRNLVLADPTMKVADLVEKLKEQGHEMSAATVGTIRSDFIAGLEVIKAAGRLKPAPKAA